MGLFDKNYEETSEKFYNEIKDNLKAKDGNKHIILVQTHISRGNRTEIEYTKKIDSIIQCMQRDGYEIIDIKVEVSEHWRKH